MVASVPLTVRVISKQQVSLLATPAITASHDKVYKWLKVKDELLGHKVKEELLGHADK